jgi:hypothetical protein
MVFAAIVLPQSCTISPVFARTLCIGHLGKLVWQKVLVIFQNSRPAQSEPLEATRPARKSNGSPQTFMRFSKPASRDRLPSNSRQQKVLNVFEKIFQKMKKTVDMGR